VQQEEQQCSAPCKPKTHGQVLPAVVTNIANCIGEFTIPTGNIGN
jgi:hypothetical protein